MFTKEEAKSLRIEFWNVFNSKSKQLKSLRGKPIPWIKKNTGIKGLELKFDADNSNAYVMIQIATKYESKREKLYNLLLQYEPIIKSFSDEDLIWEKDHQTKDGIRISRIYFQLSDVSIYNKSMWNLIHGFFIDRMLLLEKAYLEIQDILIEKVKSSTFD